MTINTALLNGTTNLLNLGKKNHSPLTSKQWIDALDVETGRLLNGDKILQRVRHGGVEASIRSQVWPFLLNLCGLESTWKEREVERVTRRQAYEDLKWRCKAVRDSLSSRTECVPGNVNIITGMELTVFLSEDVILQKGTDEGRSMASQKAKPGWIQMDARVRQEFINWQRIMRLDAVRIDMEWTQLSPAQANITRVVAKQLAMEVGLRDDGMREPRLQHHAARLVSILEVYALYDPEIGYCQGMSDLLSPFVAHLDEDHEAFWCFASFMHIARHNFRMDEEGIKRQLQTVSQIIKHSDPQLYKHLEKIQAADCYFVYRMVVVLLRRELSFGQTVSLWEALWADRTAARLDKVKISCRRGRSNAPPTDDLLLYVIAAAIVQKRKAIVDNCLCMEEVLEECNGMSGNLNIWALLDDARGLISAIRHKVSADVLIRKEEL